MDSRSLIPNPASSTERNKGAMAEKGALYNPMKQVDMMFSSAESVNSQSLDMKYKVPKLIKGVVQKQGNFDYKNNNNNALVNFPDTNKKQPIVLKPGNVTS